MFSLSVCTQEIFVVIGPRMEAGKSYVLRHFPIWDLILRAVICQCYLLFPFPVFCLVFLLVPHGVCPALFVLSFFC